MKGDGGGSEEEDDRVVSDLHFKGKIDLNRTTNDFNKGR